MDRTFNYRLRLYIMMAIIGVILVVSLVFVLFGKKTGGRVAYVYRDNEVIASFRLDNPAEEGRYRFETADASGYNTVEIYGGKSGVVDASCPDGLCMNMGFKASGPLPITCLPNHLVIIISSEDESDLPDGIAY